MIVDLRYVFEYKIEMYVKGVHLKAIVFNIRCSLSYCLSFWCRMNVHRPDEFVAPVSVLPAGVANCDCIPRSSWIQNCVTLRNEAGDDVAKGVSHSVDADDVVDMDRKPLGDDRLAIYIAESLCETEIPSSWMWSMHSWHIKHVFLNGVSLYDHDQTDIYKKALIARGRPVRVGVRPYASHHQGRDPESQPKKESLLTTEAILEVSIKSCCPNNCLQPFP